MSEATLGRPRALQRDDRCEDFDCGSEPLNDYLQRFAWTNQQAGAARTGRTEDVDGLSDSSRGGNER